MSDVYIAFVRDDQSYAESLAVALQGSGFGVSRSSSVVEAIQECPAILVLWSPAAARSKLFMDAAERAYRSGKMILARMGVDPLPAVFAGVESHTLTRWSGDPESPDIDGIVFQVDRLVSRARLGQTPDPQDHYEPEHRPRRPASGVVHAFPGSQQARPAPQPPTAPPSYAAEPHPHQPEPMRPAVRAAATIHAPQTDPLPAPPPPPQVQSQSDPLAAEAAYWRRIQRSANPDDFYAYLERYGSAGAFAEIAEARLRALTPQPPEPHFPPQHAPAPPSAPMHGQARPQHGAVAGAHGLGHVPPQAPATPAPPPRRHDLSLQGLNPAQAREHRPAEPRQPSRGGMLDPHPARYDVPPAPPEPTRRSGGGVRGLVFLVLIAAMLAGAFYIYSAFTGGAEPSSNAENSEEWAPPAREDSAEPPEAAFVEPGQTEPSDPIFDERFDDAPPRGAAQKQTRPAAPPPATEPRAAGAEPSGAELYRQRQTAEFAPSGEQSDLARDAALAFGDAAPIRPVWASRPSEEDLLTHYPQQALRGRVAGRVVLDCVITASLSTKCLIESEQPTGYGFGEAGIRVSQSFQSGPYLADRRPAAGEKVQLTIDFRPPR